MGFKVLRRKESMAGVVKRSPSNDATFTFKRLVVLVVIAALVGIGYQWKSIANQNIPQKEKPLCPIPDLIPIKESNTVQFILKDKTYANDVIDRFTGAIQVDTIVYDGTRDYSKFGKFHDFLEKTYPLVYSTANVTKVNDYGLVFYFAGSNSDLKPIMLAAHQDTVPIGDPNDWKEDPLGGRFDGEKFYGRGASDCKNLLIGLMEAAEKLIKDGKANFSRGVILAFGFDEEINGWNGAYRIAEYLEETFGKYSMEAVIDEGPFMFSEMLDDYYGIVVNGEKGYADLNVKINTPGGHSSNPKDHTSIGMLSKFLTDYEDDVFTPVLVPENPMMGFFECLAEQGTVSNDLSDAGRLIRYDEKAREYIIEYAQDEPSIKYSLRTSQAIDIIEGGDKANSLPREVEAVINHRIVYGNDLSTILEKAIRHGSNAATKFGIGLEVDGTSILPETENGLMNITFFSVPFSTAPYASTNDTFWSDFTSVIKSFYETEVFPEKFNGSSNKKFIISPGIMTPNTDTRHYWNLSKRVIRSQPGAFTMFETRAHGPDEWFGLEGHLQTIAFYYNYISHICIEEL